jgi:hypothetical protein
MSYPPKKRLLILGSLALVLGLLFLVNWLLYKFLGWFLGPLLSLTSIFSFYYLSLRRLARSLAFPGITTLMKRTLEHDFCKRMSDQVMRHLTELRNVIEMCQGSARLSLEHTEMLHMGKYLHASYLFLACQKVVQMVGSLQGQVEAQRESQHVVHPDQE